MVSRRDIIGVALAIPFAAAVPAGACAGLICAPTGGDEWQRLVSAEREAAAQFTTIAEEHDAAHDRYIDVQHDFLEEWQSVWDARRFPDVPRLDGEADAAHETRVVAAVREWNAENAVARKRRDDAQFDHMDKVGLTETTVRYNAAYNAHQAAILAVISFPLCTPEALTHKLQLILNEYGDEHDVLGAMLSSIEGAQA